MQRELRHAAGARENNLAAVYKKIIEKLEKTARSGG
jgi:hypothetical protein